MAKLSHSIEYAFALAGVRLAQALPSALADTIAASLGSTAHTLLTSRRRIAFDNLKRAMGGTLSDEQMSVIVRNVFRNTSRSLIEFARLGRTVKTGVGKIVVADGLDVLEKVYNEGKGGIVVTAHFGSWELFGAWVGTLGFPMDFVTGVQHNRKVDELLTGFRKEIGVGLISIAGSVRGVFRALKANRLIGLISDQHAPGGIAANFFGRPAATPKGPAAFAVASGAPVLPFVMRRERHDRHIVMAGEAIYPPGSGDREKDIKTVTEAYTGYFEACIRQYPDQWLWTHRRWKI
ncbi:MAG: lysophospholipid acyltransferase family protein [candidate division Zixibacteria bacterium]|nr:lysophospholipid acyltransferase family protein [candidate division Zixibacteria bacterium]